LYIITVSEIYSLHADRINYLQLSLQSYKRDGVGQLSRRRNLKEVEQGTCILETVSTKRRGLVQPGKLQHLISL